MTTPKWSGINHLALVTTRHGRDGPLLPRRARRPARRTVGAPGFRHYFFDFGPQCTVAFFEYDGLEARHVRHSRPACRTRARRSSITCR